MERFTPVQIGLKPELKFPLSNTATQLVTHAVTQGRAGRVRNQARRGFLETTIVLLRACAVASASARMRHCCTWRLVSADV